MKKRNTLVKKIAAALLASLFYTDTILLASGCLSHSARHKSSI